MQVENEGLTAAQILLLGSGLWEYCEEAESAFKEPSMLSR
jgi:hypothetical protein